jgi:exosortase
MKQIKADLSHELTCNALPMPEMRSYIYLVGMILLGVLVFVSPLNAVGSLIFKNETYSHIFLIPLVSLILIAVHRKNILAGAAGKPALGFFICATAIILYAGAEALRGRFYPSAFRGQGEPNDYLSLCMAGVVVWVIGSFISVYGPLAFKRAQFALLFLAFAIPIPTFLLNGVVSLLQHASAEVSNFVFTFSGAAFHRNGLVFEFSNVAVQVAEQCSGVRSSLSLFILSTVTGYLFLRTVSRRLLLALAVFPITVFKNALRIVTITLLANHVDERFLTDHWIHRGGGIPFFGVALMLFIPLVWIMRKSESLLRTPSGRQ